MDKIAPLIVVLIIIIGIFVLAREFICWYFKINDRILLMQEQNFLLKNILLGNSSQVKSLDANVVKTPEQSESEKIETDTEKKSKQRRKLIFAIIIIVVGALAVTLQFLNWSKI